MKIECEILTPQFKGSRILKMLKQSGTFDSDILLFESHKSYWWKFKPHNVQFYSLDDFERAVIDKSVMKLIKCNEKEKEEKSYKG